MSSALRGTEGDDSKGFGALPSRFPSVLALRSGFAVAGIVGAVALIVATFSTVISIKVGTTSKVAGADTSHTGWERHGPALLLLAGGALALLWAALRGARTAMLGLAACGLAALLIALAWDRPHVHDTGAVGDLYAEARANPAAGYYLETLGGALLLFSGGGLLVLTSPGRTAREPEPEPEPEMQTAAPGGGRREGE